MSKKRDTNHIKDEDLESIALSSYKFQAHTVDQGDRAGNDYI